MRPADADDRVFLGVVERGAEPDAGFGARVASRERRAEAAPRFVGEAGRDGPPPAMMKLHARQVEGVEVGSRSMSASWVGTPATVVICSRASELERGVRRASAP